jgi:AcrR family transcriptional regulator
MNQNEEAGTARALIEAGRQLFTRHGYDGTSVRAITAEAGANLGAITYHFGSKRELYDRVVESAVAPLAERVEAAAAGPEPVLDRVEAIVREYFAYLAANPELPQLMMQELALGGVPPAVVAEPLKRVHGALTRLVTEGQAEGVIRPGPRLVLGIFILSVPVHLGMLHRAIEAHIGLDLLEERMRRSVTDSAVAFVRAGLSPDQRQDTQPDARQETPPDPRQETQPDPRQETQPEPRQETQPEPRQVTRQDRQEVES